MDPKFYDELNLRNSSRSVRAGGPCNWQPDDVWAEIREVRITQGPNVGSCGTASTTVQNGRDQEWWLDATSSSQFARGSAEPQAVAIVHKTTGEQPPYPWSDTVSGNTTVKLK